ncbi:excisionase [Lactococcus hircilactis]|uniref:Excisionase n=1 Tax=Lactococcus hircilactis TaxID=1494462 RepID=A0A7X1ZBZ8_9LACT|nr:excisionase [Lactococcus hircilactis]MQW40517.1 excisionase [Lactococcus hircilactis]
MPYAKVTYIPVDDPDKATHGDYKHLMQRWEGLSKPTAKKWASEMRDNPMFSNYVLNPEWKTVMIDYDGFKKFVEWKSQNLYKKKGKIK